jgi:hypothetical protein
MSGPQRSGVRSNLGIALGISNIKHLTASVQYSLPSIVGQMAKSNAAHQVFVWQPMAQWDNGVTVSAIATATNRQLCGFRKEQHDYACTEK